MADVRISPGSGQPTQLLANLEVDGVNRGTFTYNNTWLTDNGAPRRLAVGFDAASLGTGIYPYTLEVTKVYGTQQVSDTATGELVVVNRVSSPYGAGWSVAGVEQIVPGQRSGALLLVGADGSSAIYESIGSNMWRAPAGEYRDTIRLGAVKNPLGVLGTYYYRTLLDRKKVYYNTVGLQKWVSAPDSSKVEYKYQNESNLNSRLDSIRISPYESALKYAFETVSDTVYRVRDPSGRLMTVSLDATQNLRSIADPGLTPRTQFTYNSRRVATWRSRRGHVTTYAYWGNTALLQSVTLPATHAGAATTSFTPTKRRGLALTATGNVVDTTSATTINGPRTDVNDVVSLYVNKLGAPVLIRDPHGSITNVEYDAAHELLVTRVHSPDGRVQRFRYDPSARLVWAEDSTHSAGRDSVTFTYGSTSAPSEPTQISTPRSAGVRDLTRYYYNSMGLPDSIIDARGHKSGYAYNVRGQVSSVTEYAVPVTASTAPPTPANLVTTLKYHPVTANLDTTITPLGKKTAFTRDSKERVVKVVDATGDSIKYTYNDMNWLTSVIQFDSSTISPYNLVQRPTTTQYDADGNRLSITDPRLIVRRWEYDALGRDTAMVDEFLRKEIRRYNLAGNVVTTRNRQGDTITAVYDALGRDTLRIIHAITIDAGERDYYDRPGSNTYVGQVLVPEDRIRTSYDVMGRVLTSENLNGSLVSRIWNKEGTLRSETQTLKTPLPRPSGPVTFTYTYNRASQRATLHTSLYNRTFTYSYGAGGVLESVAIPGVGAVTIRHDALGRRDSVAYPNGTVARYRFDKDGRPRYIDVRRLGNQLLALDYSIYDNAGRLLNLFKTDNRTSPVNTQFTWRYGPRGFLRAENMTGSSGNEYSYDAAGNMIWSRNDTIETSFTLVGGSNRIQSRSRATLHWIDNYTNSYDLNGNLTYEIIGTDISTIQHFYHDAANRMVRTVSPADPPRFYYDGVGRTVWRPIPSWGRAWQLYDGANVAIHNNIEFVHGPGTDDPLVALAPAGQGICGSSAAYFITLGNRLLDFQAENGTDCTTSAGWSLYGSFAGAIQNSYSFNLSSSSASDGGSAAGISHFRNRFYSAEHGRFLQEDPIGFAGGLNLYQYAGNNPATYTDPFGLCPDPGDPTCRNDVKFGGVVVNGYIGKGITFAAGGFSSSRGSGLYFRVGGGFGAEVNAGGEGGVVASLEAFRGASRSACAGGGPLSGCLTANLQNERIGHSYSATLGTSAFATGVTAHVEQSYTFAPTFWDMVPQVVKNAMTDFAAGARAFLGAPGIR